MYRSIKQIIILGFFVVVMICSLSKSVQQSNNLITLEALPKATKGFPVVIKVTVEGPKEIPYMTVYDGYLPITVYMTSKSDGKEFAIKSFRTNIELEMTDREGNTHPKKLPVPTIVVPNGQKYTMLFDLWSLRKQLSNEIDLADVPPEQYSVYLEFNTEKLKSNSIDLDLIEPNEQEKQFIQKIREAGKFVGTRYGVRWDIVLDIGTRIPSDGISSLTQVSREQISFHKLLSEVNTASEQARSKSIKDVNDAKLPKFFEPERQLLLLELKGNSAAERENLLKQYPQLKGSVEKLNAGNQVFLRYRPQSASRSEPNKPTEPNK